MFGNDLFERLYDHLDQAVSGGAAYVRQSAEAVKKAGRDRTLLMKFEQADRL